MKKKTFKKILNAQLKLAGGNGCRYVSTRRIIRVTNYVLSHRGYFRMPIAQVIRDIDSCNIINDDGTVWIGKAVGKSILYTDC